MSCDVPFSDYYIRLSGLICLLASTRVFFNMVMQSHICLFIYFLFITLKVSFNVLYEIQKI